MKIGVWIPLKYLHSVRIYFEQVSKRLEEKGVTFVPFTKGDELPEDVDLYWDPTCTGGKNPTKKFLSAEKPMVATVHGAANMALPHHYTYKGWKNQLEGYFINAKRLYYWHHLRYRMHGVITVSNFAKEEIVRELDLDGNIITPIYHGFDKKVFKPVKNAKRDYLFHVSVFQPVKNIETLVKAYHQLDEKTRLPLVLVVPGFQGKIKVPGLKLITEAQPQSKIAEYMQHARAFILPSVRESFGLPLIEAMACGTPVITSFGSACEEVASGTGILCHPDDVSDWREAMELLSTDDAAWQKHHELSLQRAKDFGWGKSATAHYEFFQSILEKHGS